MAEKTEQNFLIVHKALEAVDQNLEDRLSALEKKTVNMATKPDVEALAGKVKLMQEQIDNLGLDELRKQLEDLQKQVDGLEFPSKEDFNLLRSRVDSLENLMAALRKAIGDIEKRMKGLGGGGADPMALQNLEEEVERLKKELTAHKEQTGKHFILIDGILPTKADKADLIDLQNSILDKLRDMI